VITCPRCDLALERGARACPRCGAVLGPGEAPTVLASPPAPGPSLPFTLLAAVIAFAGWAAARGEPRGASHAT
jgi:hypothetical protein